MTTYQNTQVANRVKWLDVTARGIEKVVRPVGRLTNRIGQFFLVAIMLLTVADVILRYALRRPIASSSELVGFMLSMLIFFALANTQFEKRHLSIDLVTSHLSAAVRPVLEATAYLLAIITFALITWQSFLEGLNLHSNGTTSGVLHWPLYPFLLITAFASALFCLALLAGFLDATSEAVTKNRRAWLAFLPAAVAVVVVLTFPMWMEALPLADSRTAIGLVSLALLLLLVFGQMQVGPAMLLVSFLGLTILVGIQGSLSFMGSSPYNNASTFSMVALPLYILMGEFCFRGGLGEDLFQTAYKWLGHFRGGLLMTSVVGCAGFAAISGSTMATAITVGKVAMPEMNKYGYDNGLAAGCIAASGTMGIMIPPSNAFIIFAFLTGTSIGALFIAGIIPGVLQALSYIGIIMILMRINSSLGPAGPHFSWKERFIGLRGSWSMILLFAAVMGSMYFGLATPIEAAAVGAFGAFLIALAKRRMNRSTFVSALAETNRTTVMIFAMLIGAELLSNLTTASDIPIALTNYITKFSINPMIVILGIACIMLIWGCFLPLLPLLFVLIPIVFPFITAHFSPLWFAVITVMASEIGAITPPFGINVYAMAGVFKIPVSQIFRGTLPFYLCDMVRLLFIIGSPVISTFLPSLMAGK